MQQEIKAPNVAGVLEQPEPPVAIAPASNAGIFTLRADLEIKIKYLHFGTD